MRAVETAGRAIVGLACSIPYFASRGFGAGAEERAVPRSPDTAVSFLFSNVPKISV
jgi:hypothetical protein